MFGDIVAGCYGLGHDRLLQVAGEAQRGLDVTGLGMLVTACQENYQLSPVLLIDPQFRDAFTYGLNVSRISGSQPLDPCQDTSTRMYVAQAIEPLSVYVGFTNLNHDPIVATWLRAVNSF
jgi:hypothetical protein